MAHNNVTTAETYRFETVWQSYRRRVELALNDRLPDATTYSGSLHRAMRYVSLGGGKRFRATLVYACGQLAGATPLQLDAAASAVELIHAYSLTHDDLPAMDDDDQRRGKPSCHVEFDQATAILAGDALQALAFEILASDQHLSVAAPVRVKMLLEMATAGGVLGMVGGQALDMEATGKSISTAQLQLMHQRKTGQLIRAAAKLGVLSAPQANPALLMAVDRYAKALGLAFQIVDDILDQTGDSETLGKLRGSDDSMDKTTWVSLYGLERARSDAEDLYCQALESIAGLGDNTRFLHDLANFVINRDH